MDHIPGFSDLLTRARAGDRAATDELLARIRPWLEQLARQHADPLHPDGSTSDRVQEAWLRAWQKLDQFQGAADEAQALAMFRAWLARIVARLGLNAARDRGARQRTPPGKLLRLDGLGGTGAGDSAPGRSTVTLSGSVSLRGFAAAGRRTTRLQPRNRKAALSCDPAPAGARASRAAVSRTARESRPTNRTSS